MLKSRVAAMGKPRKCIYTMTTSRNRSPSSSHHNHLQHKHDADNHLRLRKAIQSKKCYPISTSDRPDPTAIAQLDILDHRRQPVQHPREPAIQKTSL